MISNFADDFIRERPDFYPLWVEGAPSFDEDVSPAWALLNGRTQVAAFWET